MAAAQAAVREQRQVLVLLQKDPVKTEPGPADLHRIGVVANILRYVTAPDGAHHIICQGVQRFRVTEFVAGWPYPGGARRAPARAGRRRRRHRGALPDAARAGAGGARALPQAPPELRAAIEGIASPGALADLAAAYMDATPAEKQDDPGDGRPARRGWTRSRACSPTGWRCCSCRPRSAARPTPRLDERQREMLLREQMAAIQKELGEGDGDAAEIAELEKAIDDAGMPEEVEAQAKKELRRLQRMPDASAEYGMIRTYLDWLIELPWKAPPPPPIDIAEARKILDADHFGLEKIKTRIIEYLAVRKLAPEGKAPILCFVGPPGVGKTSLGQSIARAMGRPFVRTSLGGVHDEAEIRGHRRTYIGALPGNIIQAIRKAGSRDCVMMLDEIDKMGAGIQGDPASAMLEVLDPEQNNTFRDNYLAVPFDLSRVVFIATANMLDTIPGPLRDRMEIISLAGYTPGRSCRSPSATWSAASWRPTA